MDVTTGNFNYVFSVVASGSWDAPSPVFIARLFVSNLLVVRATCWMGCKSTWYSSGTIAQLFEVTGVAFFVEKATRQVILGDKVINFPQMGSDRLSFLPGAWIPRVSLQIWEHVES
jgi:hypothetical protein